MNVITDSIDEIRKMKFRKVFYLHWFNLAPFTRIEFRYDCVFSPHDMEDAYGCNKYRESSRCCPQVGKINSCRNLN